MRSILAEALCEESRAQAALTRVMVEFAEVREAEYASIESRGLRELSVRSIPDELSVELTMGVNAVQNRLYYARLIKDRLPLVWLAHLDGRIDSWRLRLIAQAVDKLEHESSWERLDDRAPCYARTHTATELKQWLKRLLARLEPQADEDRDRDAHDNRRVIVTHGDESSEVWASMGRLDALTIEKALEQTLCTKAADDERTLDQFLADQFTARLTTDADGNSLVHAEIAVTVPVTTIAGLDDKPGESLDGKVALPADVVKALASEPGTIFHRVVTDPMGDILDVTRLGRFFTGELAFAIKLRDRCCQFPGCPRPAERTQIDHRIPHPDGPTSAANGQLLCVRHHQMKTVGIFTSEVIDGQPVWHMPSGRTVSTGPPPSPMRQLAKLLVAAVA